MSFKLVGFLISALIGALLLLNNLSSAAIPCSKSGLSKLDEISLKLMITGTTSRKYPTNEKENAKFCGENRKFLKDLHDYSKVCLNGLSKSVISVVAFNMQRSERTQFCNLKKKGNYVEFGECANSNRKDIIKCWKKMVNDMVVVKNNVTDAKLKLPFMCCNYFAFKDCTMNVVRKVGDPVCSTERIDKYEMYIDKMALDPINLVCTDFTDDSDKCANLLEEKMPKNIKPQNKWKGVIVPVIELLETIQ